MLKIFLHAIGRFLLTVIFGIPPVNKITEEQCIVVANHNTHIDIMVLLRLFPLRRVNKIKIIAAKDYFSRGVSGYIGNHLFDLILVERHATKAEAALAPLKEALSAGYSIIMFPEGTRGEPGVLQRFKTGVGKLALDFHDLPVYPVFLQGVEKTLPRGGLIPVPFNIKVCVMPALYGRDFLHEEGTQGRKLFTARLESCIRAATTVSDR
jgi:1-acyl-sn-glycerol-3-phosphate acyltransferase